MPNQGVHSSSRENLPRGNLFGDWHSQTTRILSKQGLFHAVNQSFLNSAINGMLEEKYYRAVGTVP